jgi:lysozyme family protein
MADVKRAIDYILREEDSTLSGVITNVPGDRGGLTRFGISIKAHPELAESGFFTEQMGNEAALALAEQVYERAYAAPLRIADINAQKVATAALSYAVNRGQANAVILLQRVCIACGKLIRIDAKMGPLTVAAINACDPAKFLIDFTVYAKLAYQQIANDKPSNRKFLQGWWNRADGWSKAA